MKRPGQLTVRLESTVKAIHSVKLVGYHVIARHAGFVEEMENDGLVVERPRVENLEIDDWLALNLMDVSGSVFSNDPMAEGAFARHMNLVVSNSALVEPPATPARRARRWTRTARRCCCRRGAACCEASPRESRCDDGERRESGALTRVSERRRAIFRGRAASGAP